MLLKQSLTTIADEGIGVRTSVYLQFGLSVISTVLRTGGDDLDHAGRPVTLLDVVRAGTLTLLTGMALVMSALIQARTIGLTVYHTLIILHLSWITVFTAVVPYAITIMQDPHSQAKSLREALLGHGRQWKTVAVYLDCMFFAFSIHISFMAAFGLLLFSTIKSFDHSEDPCTESTIIYVFGLYPHPYDRAYRELWRAVYIIAVVPILNVYAVMLALLPLLAVFIVIGKVASRWAGTEKYQQPTHANSKPGAQSQALGAYAVILTALVMNVCLIMTLEKSIRANRVSPGEGDWSLGQTFALVVAILPLVDVISLVLKSRTQVIRDQDAPNP